jgi:hypothetical protein
MRAPNFKNVLLPSHPSAEVVSPAARQLRVRLIRMLKAESGTTA